MDQLSAMDKKIQSRFTSITPKSSQDNKSADNLKKSYPRKREHDKVEFNKKLQSGPGGRAGHRYVRPREKVDCQIEQKPQSEFGSLQRCGGKKQNINHLLSWWGPGPTGRCANPASRSTYFGKKNIASYSRYNKEHYLQANCQFVVITGGDYSTYDKNPDLLVDWDLVQEVKLHVTEPPACPICLCPPVAAKVTRCGHVYCFPCMLHYLSLSDNKWRKCPICFDAVTVDDLRSVKAIIHRNWLCGDEIELQLMRRDRDSLIPVPVRHYFTTKVKQMTSLSDDPVISSHTKLILATPEEVSVHIITRELEDLKAQLKLDGSEPEACFIERAISLTTARESKVLGKDTTIEGSSEECTQTTCQFHEASGDALMLNNFPSGKSAVNECTDCLKFLTIEKQDIEEETAQEIADCLDIGHMEEVLPAQQDCMLPKSVYYFYQESGGAHVYLNALNVHMLVREYGSLEKCPYTIMVKVLEKEASSMTEALRQRLRYLRHLPLTTPFEVVEVELKHPLISRLIIAEFQDQLTQREKKRKKKEKEESKIEKRVQDEENLLLGRSCGVSINTNSYQHFPSFAEDPPLSPAFSGSDGVFADQSLESEVFSEMSPPSFAQVTSNWGLKKAEKDKVDDFPTIGAVKARKDDRFSMANKAKYETQTNVLGGDNDDDREKEKVPDYHLAFSHAFDDALLKATQKVSKSEVGFTAGKKKRKKGTIVLCSGGR